MVAALRHLLVVVPGIGGSELIDPTLPVDEQRVWWSGVRSLGVAVARPERLVIDRPLQAVGLLRRFAVVPFFKSIDGYDKLWATVTGLFPDDPTDCGDPRREADPDARIVAFPYDFRLGVMHAADQLDRVLSPRLGRLGSATTVIFVAHSMGGLVARHWVAHHDEGRRCRGIIALGTPFRGAPKAIDVVVNGLYWGSRLIQRAKLSAVVRSWESVYDLASIDDRVFDTAGARFGAWELADLPGHAGYEAARKTHVATSRWWAEQAPDRRPVLMPFRGSGQGTPARLLWNGSQLRILKDPVDDERDGDGTVPGWAAIPPEWSGPTATQATHATSDTHGAISHTASLSEQLVLLNAGDPPPIRGITPGRLVAGFDVDDLAEPGDLLAGTLLLDGVPVDGRGINGGAGVLTAALQTDDGVETSLQPVLEPSGSFSVQLPAGIEGVVELNARIDLPGDARRRAVERVVVSGAAE